jgi:hypothetical protein
VIRVLLRILQFIVFLLLVRLVVRALARFFAPGGGNPRARPGSARPAVRAPEDLVLDRVCSTRVPLSRALVERVDGREEHFCSPACRDKARAAVAS